MASTAAEQLFLELINSARLDPMGDAARYITAYTGAASDPDVPISSDPNIQEALDPFVSPTEGGFGVDGETLFELFSALTPAAPLAWNQNLAIAARDHTDLMIEEDEQEHQFPGEQDLVGRVLASSYVEDDDDLVALGENIFA